MDADFWGSRVHSSKHLQASHLSSDNYLILDNSEGDEEARAWFPCPFCYVDIELSVLCSHLQDEHCFDLRNAVCPICAANLGQDTIGHFALQHSHSLKRRRKSHKSGFWMNSPSALGKELRELNSYIDSTTLSSRGNPNGCPPDPLLSPFLCKVAPPHHEVSQQDKFPANGPSAASVVKSTKLSIEDKGRERERSQRAGFIQQLVMSTIF